MPIYTKVDSKNCLVAKMDAPFTRKLIPKIARCAFDCCSSLQKVGSCHQQKREREQRVVRGGGMNAIYPPTSITLRADCVPITKHQSGVGFRAALLRLLFCNAPSSKFEARGKGGGGRKLLKSPHTDLEPNLGCVEKIPNCCLKIDVRKYFTFLHLIYNMCKILKFSA